MPFDPQRPWDDNAPIDVPGPATGVWTGQGPMPNKPVTDVNGNIIWTEGEAQWPYFEGTTPTPGTPGAPGYDPNTQFGYEPPLNPMMDPARLAQYQLRQDQQFVGHPVQKMVQYGVDPTGTFNSQMGQQLTEPMLNYALANPEMFGMLYADANGQNLGGGQFAMSQQYADQMPMEYLLSPYANQLNAGADERAQFFENNITAGQTPGAAVYTTTDFLSQAFQEGSAMYNHIWGPDGMKVQDPQQQLANFFDAFETVLGPGLGEEMMNVWGTRYMQSFDEYIRYIAANPGSQNDLSLAQWFNQQGLGMPQGGQ